MIWIFLSTLLIIWMIAPSFQKKTFNQRNFTHRGYHTQDQTIKENSIEAFKLSVDKGYGIELDIQLSLDGEVVVYHDSSLLRLEEKNLLVQEMTFRELQAYQIPSLQEVLALVDSKVMLIVEHKGSQINPLCQKAYELLKDYPGPYCIESFDPRFVAWYKHHAPDVMRGQLVQPVSKYDNVLVGLFINSMLYNFLTRPHFIALNVNSFIFNPFLKVNQWCGVQTCLWTVHKQHKTHYKWVNGIIFEYFDA